MKLKEYNSIHAEYKWILIKEDNEFFYFTSNTEIPIYDYNGNKVIPEAKVSKLEEGVFISLFSSKNSTLFIDFSDYNHYYDTGFFENTFKKESFVNKSLMIADFYVYLHNK